LLEFYRCVLRREVMVVQAMARGTRGERWIVEYDDEYYEARTLDGRVSFGGPVKSMLATLRGQGINVLKLDMTRLSMIH
jgi:hypothetical protein